MRITISIVTHHRNLPFKITAEEMYDLFGRYGALRQIRLGDAPETRGSAFVVYEDIHDAKNACEHLSGFNVGGRYLVCLYYKPAHSSKAATLAQQQADLQVLRAQVAAGEAAAKAGSAVDSDTLDDGVERRGLHR